MQLRVNKDHLELVRLDSGGMPVYHYNGQPFTGILLGHEDDGFLSWEQEHQDGYEEGWYRSYHRNGQMNIECKSHNNIIIDGTYRQWDEAGNLIHSC